MTEKVPSSRGISSSFLCYFALKQFCMYVERSGAFDLGGAPRWEVANLVPMFLLIL